MYFELLQEPILSEVCHSFKGTCAKLFDNMRKQNISFKARNHLPAMLVNQIYNCKRSIAIKLPSEEYWSQKKKKLRKHKEGERSILAALPIIFTGINILDQLTIKAADS